MSAETMRAALERIARDSLLEDGSCNFCPGGVTRGHLAACPVRIAREVLASGETLWEVLDEATGSVESAGIDRKRLARAVEGLLHELDMGDEYDGLSYSQVAAKFVAQVCGLIGEPAGERIEVAVPLAWKDGWQREGCGEFRRPEGILFDHPHAAYLRATLCVRGPQPSGERIEGWIDPNDGFWRPGSPTTSEPEATREDG